MGAMKIPPIMLFAVLAVLTLSLPSQTLQTGQNAPRVPQWVTVVVDEPVPESGLTSTGDPYFRGRQTGRSTWSVDVWGTPRPTPVRFTSQPIGDVLYPTPRGNPLGDVGVPHVNGTPMHLEEAFVDGARIVGRFSLRFGRMMHMELWLWKYWGQNSIFHGECIVTASNPGVPDIRTTCPDVKLTLKGMPPFVCGVACPVLVEEVEFGNGQAMAMPVAFVTGFPGPHECFGVPASGLTKAWPHGTPVHPTKGFTKSPFPHVRTFGGPVWGPARFSGATGAQQDQVFTCGDIVNANSAYAVYLSALKYANRACHHLEHDGSIVDKKNHPRLVYWDARVHWHTGVSPDRLGKSEGFWTNNGWSGPDVEHWLIGTLSAGDRWSPYYALDRLMEHQAHIYLMQWTHTPNWVTSQTYAARAGGWESLAVVLLYEGLRDRSLAERVKSNYFQRFEKVFLPAKRPILDQRVDHRLYESGSPFRDEVSWMPWHQSVYAMGFDYAGRYFGDERLIEAAVEASEVCLALDWFNVNGEWRVLGNQPVDPVRRSEYVEQVDWSKIPTWFDGSWSIQPIFVLKRHKPSALVDEILDSVRPRMTQSWVDETMVEWFERR